MWEYRINCMLTSYQEILWTVNSSIKYTSCFFALQWEIMLKSCSASSNNCLVFKPKVLKVIDNSWWFLYRQQLNCFNRTEHFLIILYRGDFFFTFSSTTLVSILTMIYQFRSCRNTNSLTPYKYLETNHSWPRGRLYVKVHPHTAVIYRLIWIYYERRTVSKVICELTHPYSSCYFLPCI